MASDRDFALLQEEVKCLRKKISTLVSSSGGYVNGPLTAPDSSLYPDSYLSNCGCVDVETELPDPLGICNPQDEGLTSLGDLGVVANDVVNNPYGYMIQFDNLCGVRFLDPSTENWENRNTGLSDVTLEHGCLDVWWYRKAVPNADNAILWRVGAAKILRSDNAGRTYWQVRTPDAPSGVSLSNIVFKQIASDPFNQNHFFVTAETNTAPYRTWIVKTTDDGQTWSWLEITTYNGVSQRRPIWLHQSGGGGPLLWVTTWADDNLTVVKINNDPTLTISAEYTFNAATWWEVENKFEILSPISAVDTSTIWFYGRATNPQSLGLSHIIKTTDDGLSWDAVEQGFGNDWVGGMKVGMAESGKRNFYHVRNKR